MCSRNPKTELLSNRVELIALLFQKHNLLKTTPTEDMNKVVTGHMETRLTDILK